MASGTKSEGSEAVTEDYNSDQFSLSPNDEERSSHVRKRWKKHQVTVSQFPHTDSSVHYRLGGDACLFGKMKDRSDVEYIFNTLSEQALEEAIEYLTDPIHGSPAQGRTIEGIVTIHVDDVFLSGSDYFVKTVVAGLKKDFTVGSLDMNDIMFGFSGRTSDPASLTFSTIISGKFFESGYAMINSMSSSAQSLARAQPLKEPNTPK